MVINYKNYKHNKTRLIKKNTHVLYTKQKTEKQIEYGQKKNNS